MTLAPPTVVQTPAHTDPKGSPAPAAPTPLLGLVSPGACQLTPPSPWMTAGLGHPEAC